ncbi:MAG: hypothetical protein U1A06_07695 [Hoeflea sp.]|nr:hypothetical protein [Hoeflea sp.]
MKKILIITASVLALGVASIAAGADGATPLPATADIALNSLTPQASAATTVSSRRSGPVGGSMIERDIRLVTTGIAPVKSCDAANWPYYPADCLKRVESAGL